VSPIRLLWAVAVVLAVVVVGMSYLDRGDEATWSVLVAKERIPGGTIVEPGMYDVRKVPRDEDAIEPGTLTAGASSYLHFRRVARPIYPGELLAASDFLPRNTAPQQHS
jgi:hypothetical protein